MALMSAGRNAVARMVAESAGFKRHGNISGEPYVTSYGRLAEPYLTALRKAGADGSLVYVIRSYATPIAWAARTADGVVWMVPAVSYSPTTQNHQSAVRAALRQDYLSADRECYVVPTPMDVLAACQLTYDAVNDRLTRRAG